MTLKKIETVRNTAGLTTEVSSGSWANWKGTTPPWASIGDNFLSLSPGRYRVECPGTMVPYQMEPFESMGAHTSDGIVASTRPINLYCSNSTDSVGNVFITRLA